MKRCDCWVHQQLRRGPVPPAPPVDTTLEVEVPVEAEETAEEPEDE